MFKFQLKKCLKLIFLTTVTATFFLGCTTVVEREFPPTKLANIKVGKEFIIYKLNFAYDHAIIYNKNDKKWHLYGIWKDCRSFVHLTADKLTQRNWKKEDKTFSYKNKNIWAPHIIEHDGLFYMFYTSIGVPREMRLAVSKDLYNWEHPSDKPIFAFTNKYSKNLKNKDPMVFRYKDQWIMYYSMMKDAKHWVVGYSTSNDLYNWSSPKICFDEHTEEPNVESPFVVQRGKYFYLFLSARPWPLGAEEVFVSDSPFKWEAKNIVKSINPWHAAEVVQDLDGKWYLSRSSGEQTDFRLAPMEWNDK
ncbi:family 43 glycosylhydrolase [Lentisphaerota bacterium WC36G]|nr:family 43 glycosylhydrolase [Lentisphaerae bacterium WC36]